MSNFAKFVLLVIILALVSIFLWWYLYGMTPQTSPTPTASPTATATMTASPSPTSSPSPTPTSPLPTPSTTTTPSSTSSPTSTTTPTPTSSTSLGINLETVTFLHEVSITACPQMIANLDISTLLPVTAKSLRVTSTLPAWLTVTFEPDGLNSKMYFNCKSIANDSQSLKTAVTFTAMDSSGKALGNFSVNVMGEIQPSEMH